MAAGRCYTGRAMASEPNITPQNGNNGGQNLKATGFMLVAVLIFSFVPLAIVLGGGPGSPFLFNAVWRLGVAVGILLFLLLLYRSVLLNAEVLALAGRSIKSRFFWGAVILSFSYALFSWSSNLIDVSISAILFELWPLLFIALAAWLFREEGQYRKNLRSAIPLALVALAGLGFVVISQTGGPNFENISLSNLIAGVSLGLSSAVAGACVAFTFRWGKDFADQLPVDAVGSRSVFALTLFGAVAAHGLSSFVGAVLSAGIGFALGEKVETGLLTYLGFGLLVSIVAHALPTILFWVANLTTDNLGVNALGYSTPVFALVWLALFSEIAVASIPFLIIGTAAIIAANLLINFEAERLLGFKALVISLWACGTIAYLRDPVGWGWLARTDGYFDVLMLSGTAFALILSFRTARLSGRIQEEDNRGFALFEELAELERQGVIGPGRVSKYVLTINRKDGRELAAAYTQAHRELNAALVQARKTDRKRLVAAVVELNRLAHSRQRGTNFGEICALSLLAGMVVGIALFSRPAEVSGLTGFLVEMFAMLFSAVILFLGFNVLDLERERRSRILEPDPEHGGYRAALGDMAAEAAAEPSNRRTVEQWISIGVGGALIVAYSGLFLHKWGLWEQIAAAATGFLP